MYSNQLLYKFNWVIHKEIMCQISNCTKYTQMKKMCFLCFLPNKTFWGKKYEYIIQQQTLKVWLHNCIVDSKEINYLYITVLQCLSLPYRWSVITFTWSTLSSATSRIHKEQSLSELCGTEWRDVIIKVRDPLWKDFVLCFRVLPT